MARGRPPYVAVADPWPDVRDHATGRRRPPSRVARGPSVRRAVRARTQGQLAFLAAFLAGALRAGAFFAVARLVAGAFAALRTAGFTVVTARTPSLRIAATNFSPRACRSA